MKDFVDEVDINQYQLTRNFRVQLEQGEEKEVFEDIMACNNIILNHPERTSTEENNTRPSIQSLLEFPKDTRTSA